MSIAMLVMWMWMNGQAGQQFVDTNGNFTTYSLITVNAACEEGGFISIPTDGGYDKIAYCHEGKWYRYSAEPLDVPAVQEDTKVLHPDTDGCYDCFTTMRWTCSDRRRVLLTDESGKRHCVLFTQESAR